MAEEIQSLEGKLGDARLVVSMAAATEEEFVEMASLFQGAGADALELVLMGCQNYSSAPGMGAQVRNDDPEKAFRLMEKVRKAVTIPI